MTGDVPGFADRFGGFAFRPGALRYDAHETAAYLDLLPFAESLRLVTEVTPAAVQAHVRGLLDRILARLPAGWEASSPLELDARSHILCVRGRSTARTEAAVEALQGAKARTSLRGGRIRVAPHLYNGAPDVERLLMVLAEHSDG